MPENSYVNKIRELDYAGLLELWGEIEKGAPAGWAAGKAFEYLALRAFELDGADIRWPYIVYVAKELVEQIDGVAYAGGLSCLIESKDYERKVNVEPIAKLRSQLARRPAGTVGVVFSRAGFTESARILAQYMAPQTVLLWDGFEIEYALAHQKMVSVLCLKYRHAVEHGLPDYNVMEELL